MKNLTFWYNILTSQVILAKKKVTKFKNQQANTKYYLHVLTYSTNVYMNSPLRILYNLITKVKSSQSLYKSTFTF